MKRFLMVLTLAMVLILPLTAGEKPDAQLEKDKAAIKQAALDYFEGWYEGNVEREDRAMHNELVKRGWTVLPTGKGVLRGIGKGAMVEYTRAGFGKGQAPGKGEIKVKIFHVFRNTASGLVVSNHYHDYIHLVKDNGKWQIVNVLWEPNQKMPPPPARTKEKKEKKEK